MYPKSMVENDLSFFLYLITVNYSKSSIKKYKNCNYENRIIRIWEGR